MYEQLIDTGLAHLGLALDSVQRVQLDRYIAELERFNPTYKLVGSSGEELVIRHIFDSLAAVKTIEAITRGQKRVRLADLGSGAGLPGIPLAIALPHSSVALVERMQRRVGFLRSAIVASALTERVRILDVDLSQVRERFDVVTFRALRPLVEILDRVAPLVDEGAMICAYKGQREQVLAELAAVEEGCKSRWESELVAIEVPMLASERTLCLLRKI
ncbi:MAG: 16S rRNA (guanine(527)-N(7))-methyltransferase RsmG [Sphaerochaeta sp.]|jgi:16S rRNA (guanine527-N7)-methyltransferase|nr:16S rRNA (guanine(527)-N(7))-methyltransferase RsmG [Sphaerochaeta sp.]MDX9914552.1 16S rRNA (guanine(527)-N(7))-methyltransferase RsmG [Sphaerochaeta sp.]